MKSPKFPTSWNHCWNQVGTTARTLASQYDARRGWWAGRHGGYTPRASPPDLWCHLHLALKLSQTPWLMCSLLRYVYILVFWTEYFHCQIKHINWNNAIKQYLVFSCFLLHYCVFISLTPVPETVIFISLTPVPETVIFISLTRFRRLSFSFH